MLRMLALTKKIEHHTKLSYTHRKWVITTATGYCFRIPLCFFVSIMIAEIKRAPSILLLIATSTKTKPIPTALVSDQSNNLINISKKIELHPSARANKDKAIRRKLVKNIIMTRICKEHLRPLRCIKSEIFLYLIHII